MSSTEVVHEDDVIFDAEIVQPSEASTALRPVLDDEREEFIAGLHQMADWFTEHPELIPLQSTRVYLFAYSYAYSAEPMEVASALARSLPRPVTKNYSKDAFELNARFGPHRFQFSTKRENICTKVVTGKRVITEEVPDPTEVAKVPKVVVTSEEEIFEWVCPPSLLGDES